MKFGTALLFWFVGVLAGATGSASTPNVEQTISIARVDGSPLQLFVTLPEGATAKLPLVLIIDGSGCVSSRRTTGCSRSRLGREGRPASGFDLHCPVRHDACVQWQST